ncbi:hypothetical protein KP509_05G009400 [Ceratopteris richardii]|uniref:Uncharacterized protein n=1 Tax=Ceratopteris richardii TaxID=49495 RepID=A0A8T2UJ84_CERRI|nr:hypothetical protein KP509_05G009400 [Ceratopteris richardii]
MMKMADLRLVFCFYLVSMLLLQGSFIDLAYCRRIPAEAIRVSQAPQRRHGAIQPTIKEYPSHTSSRRMVISFLDYAEPKPNVSHNPKGKSPSTHNMENP